MNKQWLLRCQRPLLAVFCAMPWALMLCCICMPAEPLRWFSAPALYLASAWLCLLPRGKTRWYCGLIASVLMLTALVAILPWQDAWQLLLLPVGFIALLMALLPMGGWLPDRELHLLLPIAGLVGYLAAQFLVSRMPDVWSPIGQPLACCFLLYLLLCMLMLNRISLANAMVDGVHRPPAALKRRNRLLTIVLFLAAVLVGLAPALGELLNRLWSVIVELIRSLISLLPVPEGTSGMSGGDGGGAMFGMIAEETEPSLFAVIMERIMMVLVVLLMVVGIFALIRGIIKAFFRLFRYLNDRFRGLAAASSEDYTDESVDTREGDDRANGLLLQMLGRIRPEPHGPLKPREQLRRLYARLRRTHPEWGEHQTARETLPDQTAVLYEKARYSQHDVTAGDVEAFEQKTRTMR